MPADVITFKPLLIKLAVTSVKFYNNCLLAGVGGDLCIFGYSDSVQLKSRITIFESFVIHGISQNTQNSKICVFGGKYIAVLSADFNSSNSCLKCLHKWRVTDWVLCCQWIEEENQLAILSAHNVLSLWNPYTGTNLANVDCADKCLLYSATVVTDRWLDTVVVAGTVFQQIIIWAVADDALGDRPILHKLQGHKGVIFSVTYDRRSHLISSTSDDRSVRVWSIVFPQGEPRSVDDWMDATVTLAFTVFGHTSRVWQSHILANNNIISIGEDSLLCQWQYGGACVSQRETHQGGGAWCLDVCESQSLVATGGADGGVTLWPLDSAPTETRCLTAPHDPPRRVTLLPSCRVLIVTHTGALMLHSEPQSSWSTVFTDSRLANYCLLQVSPSRQLIGLASINGHIVILRSTDFSEVVNTQVGVGKIFSLHWLSEDTLLSCHDHGKLSVLRIGDSDQETVGMVYLPACKERWTTSAVMCGATVVYGDRAGNIHSSPVVQPPLDPSVAVRSMKRAHSRLGVCSLSVVAGRVWSTGRDRTVKQFTLNDHTLALVSASKLPFDWVAQVLYIPHLLGTTLLCFHESSIVLWSLQERRRLVAVQCGGGHRSWDCIVDNGHLCFTYLKDKTAHVLQYPLLQIWRPVLMDGFHASEINSMALIKNGWVATGGEDGTVRVSHFSSGSWTTPVVEHNHLSSVRSVHVSSCQQQTLLFSAGGRAQIKVWRVHLELPTSLTELQSVMLRDEKSGRHWLSSAPVSDPETRYMDLHTVPLSDSVLCVLAACSDALLRIFHFDLKNNELYLHKSLRARHHCLLRVTSFQCNAVIVVVTTATDGSVTFWDTENEQVAFFHEQLHKSGVNGLSVSRVEDLVLLATGGDDNTLSLCCYHVTSTSQLSARLVASWASSTLHSSVITGVEIVREWLVCSGGDQRITLLSWSLSGDQLSVQCVAQYTCSVPDMKGLTLLEANKEECVICFYGVGFEVMEIKLKKR